MEVATLKFSMRSDKQDMNVEMTLPLEVANYLLVELMDWKNRFYIKPVAYDKYIENLNKQNGSVEKS